MEEWKDYEFQVIDDHIKNYRHLSWHTDVIPEEELYLAGFIHDFNNHRLKRIARAREAKDKKILFSDYGMDFLAKDSDDIYHAGQAKCWYDKRYVGAKDIGTFLNVCVNRLKTTGYLYTTCKLEINLREDIQNANWITHHLVPYKTTKDQVNEIKKLEVKYEIDSDEEFEELSENEYPEKILIEKQIPEIKYKLRPYQVESIEFCSKQSKKSLEIFTGGGKTLIIGHMLKKKKYKKIICIAPLRISVEQLKNRIMKFIPMYDSLLIDSDYEGITDLEIIKNRINQHIPTVIFTTFKSFLELKDIMDYDNGCLIVDEAHNIINREDICDMINKFKNITLLSATIPEEITDVIDIENTFKYNINEAIKNNYCVDYEVYLPYIENNKADVEILDELLTLDEDLTKKGLFLATSILVLGKRHNITYLSSIEECKEFKKVIVEIFKKYHSIDIWCKIITCYTSQKERTKIIKEFEQNNYEEIKIILSVRILDEAINLIKNDCQFITNVSKDFIRTTQRLGRGIRIDKNNKTKKNSMLLWCDEWNNVVDALTILRNEDVDFHKKIKVINANYAKNSDKEAREKVNTQIINLNEYITIKCLTPDQLWEYKYDKWLKFYNTNNRYPNKRSDDIYEQMLGYWQNRMRVFKNYKNKGIIRSDGKGNILTNARIELLTKTQGWIWECDEFTEQCNNWLEIYNKYGYPTDTKVIKMCKERNDNYKKPQDEEIIKIKMAITWIEHTRNKKLSNDHKKLAEDLPEWKLRNNDTRFEVFFKAYKKFYNENNRLPKDQKNIKNVDDSIIEYYLNNKSLNNDELEKKLYDWGRSQKQQESKLDSKEIKLLDSLPDWKWSENKLTFNDLLERWKHALEKYKKISRKSKDNDNRKAADWERSIQTKYIKKKLTSTELNILNNTQGWQWKNIE